MQPIQTDLLPYSLAWFRVRLARHMSELVRLAVPAAMMRLGLMGLGIVDVAMVGHYATEHLAWLNLANQSYVMFAIVVSLGLLMGIVVFTSTAYGSENYQECGRIWRRTIPYSLAVGAAMLVLGFFGEPVLALLGQPEDVAKQAGRLILILSFGLPAHVIFINCSMFLEGIKRPEVGFITMLVANIVNGLLNYILIYGAYGAPELGAEGSAWTSTAVRLVMAALMLAYIWYAPAIQRYGVRSPYEGRWKDWYQQRRLGYASAVSMTAEVAAFAALALFAGQLSVVALAAHGVVFQVLGVPLMISIGIGIAASVRTGIAYGRRDGPDTVLAGLSGLGLSVVTVGLFGVLIGLYTEPALRIFTDDERIIRLLMPITIIFTVGMWFDAQQMTVSSILRGLQETWWPTLLQSSAFLGVMLPASYWLAFEAERGFQGLMEGMLIGVLLSTLLQVGRWIWLMRALAVQTSQREGA